MSKKEFTIKAIGIIHTPYRTKQSCPIQSNIDPEITGTIEVFPEYSDALKDIDTFSHITLFFIFNQAEKIKLVRPTFLDDTPHGVFASRHPCRPNGLGFSTVKLLERNNNILTVCGIDILDKTPVIDIKPYIPRFDYFPGANNGWIKSKKLRTKPQGRE